ncbi:hypothetical protein O1L55_04970 [Streptomyces albulus]|nr:hypothetical protein [Streptomyces noursei]
MRERCSVNAVLASGAGCGATAPTSPTTRTVEGCWVAELLHAGDAAVYGEPGWRAPCRT